MDGRRSPTVGTGKQRYPTSPIDYVQSPCRVRRLRSSCAGTSGFVKSKLRKYALHVLADVQHCASSQCSQTISFPHSSPADGNIAAVSSAVLSYFTLIPFMRLPLPLAVCAAISATVYSVIVHRSKPSGRLGFTRSETQYSARPARSPRGPWQERTQSICP